MYFEAFAAFPFEGEILDADNMNKVKANGTPATSRYHQGGRYFLEDDKPQVGDHDFPLPGKLEFVKFV